MRTLLIAIALLAALGAVGRIDLDSALVTEKIAMESPRPIFEPVHEARRLSMPCTYISHRRHEHERVSAQNTRCTKADRSE